MVNEEAIEQAINDLRLYKIPNFTTISKKYNLNYITLIRHFKDKAIVRKLGNVTRPTVGTGISWNGIPGLGKEDH